MTAVRACYIAARTLYEACVASTGLRPLPRIVPKNAARRLLSISMYHFLSDFLKPHHFSTEHGVHHYIEICEQSEAAKTYRIHCDQGTLSEDELDGWLSKGHGISEDKAWSKEHTNPFRFGHENVSPSWSLRVL